MRWPNRIGLERVATTGGGAVAFAGMLSAPFRPFEQAAALIANSLLLALLIGLYWFLERGGPDRPLRVAGIVLLVAWLQPISLIGSTLLEGDVVYFTQLGSFSHHDGAMHVAAVYALFYFITIAVAWLLAKLMRGMPCPGWAQLTAAFTPRQLLILQTIAVVAAALRVAAMWPEAVGTVPSYFARLFATYFGALAFFVGVGLRRARGGTTLFAAFALLFLYGLVLLGGNRGDSLLPMMFGVAGYVVADASASWRLYATLGVAIVLGSGAMFIGAALREDQEGRTGQAALGRLENVGERLSDSDASEGVQGSVLRRFLRNGTHAVLTMVPERFPFDRDGIEVLPEEFRNNILPGLHFEGQAKGREARNWMLNELGFVVNWRSSVELAVVPDAWVRAGWLGVVVIAALLGLILQGFEEVLYLAFRKGHLAQVLLIAFSTAAPMAEGKDVVWGFRSLLWTFLAGWIAVWFVRVLGAGGLLSGDPGSNVQRGVRTAGRS